jgi:hypothetical protein
MASNDLYSIGFFDLQLRFAAKVAELSGLPLIETVGSHTNIYVRLGMGPRLDNANPDWLAYVSTLATQNDPAAWTYEVQCRRANLPTVPDVVASVGCFSYAPVGPSRVRLHFRPGSQLSDSPLSLSNAHPRRGELAALLSQVAALGDAVQVVGASWLYNLMAYRRLFPEPYLVGLKPVEHPYQRMPLWGQFLKRDRTLRSEPAKHFNSHIAKATSLAELSSCFPYRVLSTVAPVKLILAHMGTQHASVQ